MDEPVPETRQPVSAVRSVRSEDCLAALRSYWGYERFLPLQEQAIDCAVRGRDSVVVLPTGGGKSLCYQVPAVCMDGLTVVVSPLISLMKDQVDALRACGIAADSIHSMIDFEQRRRIADEVAGGTLKLLYLAPERLVQQKTLDFLSRHTVRQIAIDEAHCISEWGHDFRPEYRALDQLHEALPQASIHAYTATATEQVRQDIADHLRLRDPQVLVGSFDRPNLIYRVRRRSRILHQIVSVLKKHPDESGIVYCISRKEVESTAAALVEEGFRARPYHAGMEDALRQQYQDEFARDAVDVIVATVAFGMGIDKSNVRFVIHASMPKSVEAYQQESGRAGRDGLEAECWLFHSGGDYLTWSRMIAESSAPSAGAMSALTAMSDFCNGVLCRHRALTAHFGQQLDTENCAACDVCLGEIELADNPLVTGQKILSCVVRLDQRFGGDYTAKVLTGSRDERILTRQHDRLSTWGILAEFPLHAVRNWIEQLVAQGFLDKEGEYNILSVTETGWQLLRGELTPQLTKPPATPSRRARVDETSWEGVDRKLFEELRRLRRELASEESVPAYVVFGDAALRDMARKRPLDEEAFLDVKGVGEAKLLRYGEPFLNRIRSYLAG